MTLSQGYAAFCSDSDAGIGVIGAHAETRGGAAELCGAAGRGSIPTLKKLLSSGVDPNAIHPEGWCPLHAAAINKSAEACKVLLDAGADPNIGDTYSPESWQNMRHSRRAMQARDREFSSTFQPFHPRLSLPPPAPSPPLAASSVVRLLLRISWFCPPSSFSKDV